MLLRGHRPGQEMRVECICLSARIGGGKYVASMQAGCTSAAGFGASVGVRQAQEVADVG